MGVLLKTEAQIQKEILDYLKFLGAWTVKVVTANKSGVPDILACLGGKFVAIEVKRPGEKARPLQLAQIRRIRSAGGTSFETDNVEEAKRILNEYLKN